jgi:CRISPR-associated protein Cmr1
VHGTAGAPDTWSEPPHYPVLSRSYSPAVLARKQFSSWQEALAYGGKQLRLFRANRPGNEERRKQARVRTAEWDDVVNGDSADFPLGALGLPVGYHEKQTDRKFTVNAVIPREPEPEELRRASPLWIRPVGSGDSWRLLTFAFRTRFLPDAAQIYLLPDEELNTGPDDVARLTAQWMETMRTGGVFTRIIRN